MRIENTIFNNFIEVIMRIVIIATVLPSVSTYFIENTIALFAFTVVAILWVLKGATGDIYLFKEEE